MARTIGFAVIAGILGFILAVIERQAGWNLGIAPYFGIGVICGLIDMLTDKRND